MGDRLLMASRKSRKGDGIEDSMYARQEHRATERAEADGHTVVHVTRDTVSSQSRLIDRPNLRKWLAGDKLAMWDVLYVSDTDRLARMDDRGWHDIESFMYDNGKRIMTAEGVQFPPRDDSDRYQWLGLKRRARTYWEDTASKHAQGREVMNASKVASGGTEGISGRPPFGYVTSGVRYRKTFVPHPENAPLAREMFQRMADGQSGATVAAWLSAATGRPWRVKAVLNIIRNQTYLGRRDGVKFEALVSEGLWTAANATLAARSFARKPGCAVHGYSGAIYCGECGSVLYRHKSERGLPKYLCARGRQGVPEAKCPLPSLSFDAVNNSVHEVMLALAIPEQIQKATGGDASKVAELAIIARELETATTRRDMPAVARLAAEYSERESRPAEPVRVWWEPTGRVLGELWTAGGLATRRQLLAEGLRAHQLAMIVNADETAELADVVEPFDIRAA